MSTGWIVVAIIVLVLAIGSVIAVLTWSVSQLGEKLVVLIRTTKKVWRRLKKEWML